MSGSFFYNNLVYLHIFMAVVAVGFNFSYVVWIKRGSKIKPVNKVRCMS
jgi:hypothetical protein